MLEIVGRSRLAAGLCIWSWIVDRQALGNRERVVRMHADAVAAGAGAGAAPISELLRQAPNRFREKASRSEGRPRAVGIPRLSFAIIVLSMGSNTRALQRRRRSKRIPDERSRGRRGSRSSFHR